jgi:hypothetical protein
MMAAGSCKDVTPGADVMELIGQEKAKLHALLKTIPTSNQSNKGNARAWLDEMDRTIDRALCILKLQKKGPDEDPELKTAFEELDALADKADREWGKILANPKMDV